MPRIPAVESTAADGLVHRSEYAVRAKDVDQPGPGGGLLCAFGLQPCHCDVDWRWSDVLAFQAGPWMQDLIEIAGYIEGNFWRSFDEHRDADTVARASKIKLPD